jgi:hypothetical protein
MGFPALVANLSNIRHEGFVFRLEIFAPIARTATHYGQLIPSNRAPCEAIRWLLSETTDQVANTSRGKRTPPPGFLRDNRNWLRVPHR